MRRGVSNCCGLAGILVDQESGGVDPDEVSFDGDKVSITYSDSRDFGVWRDIFDGPYGQLFESSAYLASLKDKNQEIQPDSPRWAKREKAAIYRFTAPQMRLIDAWAMRHLFMCTSMFYANCHCDEGIYKLR